MNKLDESVNQYNDLMSVVDIMEKMIGAKDTLKPTIFELLEEEGLTLNREEFKELILKKGKELSHEEFKIFISEAIEYALFKELLNKKEYSQSSYFWLEQKIPSNQNYFLINNITNDINDYKNVLKKKENNNGIKMYRKITK